jgi:hypothetical protein
MEPEGATERRDLEIDMVSNLELEVSPMVICIALLLALGNPQIFLHLSYPLLGLLDLSRAKEHLLTYFGPHQWGSAFPPVQGLKW